MPHRHATSLLRSNELKCSQNWSYRRVWPGTKKKIVSCRPRRKTTRCRIRGRFDADGPFRNLGWGSKHCTSAAERRESEPLGPFSRGFSWDAIVNAAMIA
jgi:hypothetical protein